MSRRTSPRFVSPDLVDARIDVERVAKAALDGKGHPETAAGIRDIEIAEWAEDWMGQLEKSSERVLPEEEAVLADRVNAAGAAHTRLFSEELAG
jgi:hypothetical protein